MTNIDDIIREASDRSPFKGPPRDPARIERILGLLREAWTREPDTRLLQLLMNVSPRGPEPVPHLFNLEDDKLEGILRSRLGMENKEEDAPAGPTP